MKLTHDSAAVWATGQDTNADSSASYATLDSAAASFIIISNPAGSVSVDIRRASSSAAPFVLEAGAQVKFPLKENVNEIEWKRTDDSATTYTISYLYGY